MATLPKKIRPRLTVRSAAELLDKQPQEMIQVLLDQKYPKQGERVFRTPYYQQAIAGMKRYFLSGKPALIDTKVAIQGYRQLPRRENNSRVLDSFERSELLGRKLKPIANRRFRAMVGDVELRLSPDMQATEDGELRVIYFNCRNAEYSEETARRLVEIAYWVLGQNGVDIRPDQVEFVDLFTRKTYCVNEVRAKTIDSLGAEALQVTELWEEL